METGVEVLQLNMETEQPLAFEKGIEGKSSG